MMILIIDNNLISRKSLNKFKNVFFNTRTGKLKIKFQIRNRTIFYQKMK